VQYTNNFEILIFGVFFELAVDRQQIVVYLVLQFMLFFKNGFFVTDLIHFYLFSLISTRYNYVSVLARYLTSFRKSYVV